MLLSLCKVERLGMTDIEQLEENVKKRQIQILSACHTSVHLHLHILHLDRIYI